MAKQNSENEMIRIKNLRDRLEQTVLDSISDTYVNGNPNNRLPGLLLCAGSLPQAVALSCRGSSYKEFVPAPAGSALGVQ